MSSVAIIDYGMGNLHSIAKALQHTDLKPTVEVTAEAEAILSADRVVFPGVGAIGDCMKALDRLNLVPVIREAVRGKPFLGICLGLQALLENSEESRSTPCLGIIPGRVVRFGAPLKDDSGNLLKIPHMGWNRVHQVRSHPLWTGIPQDSRFYFVHSYYAVPRFSGHCLGVAGYPRAFACAVGYRNVFAVQFHPEKSQSCGLQLLQNFLLWDGEGADTVGSHSVGVGTQSGEGLDRVEGG